MCVMPAVSYAASEACVPPEQIGPTTATTSALISRSAAAGPPSAEQRSSSRTNWIAWPLIVTPSAATSAESAIGTPRLFTSPESALEMPILIGAPVSMVTFFALSSPADL